MMEGGGKMDTEMVTIYTAQGEFDETQVRSFLEAHGIPTTSWGEALRKTHAFVLNGLGEVHIQVPAEYAEQARDLLAAAERGELGLNDNDLPEPD